MLQRYWADRRIILQPYDMEVGAGTFHPATTLRCAWAKAVESCLWVAVAPAQGRSLRRKIRTRFASLLMQVILEPSLDDLQELYLNSLYAIGIDAKIH